MEKPVSKPSTQNAQWLRAAARRFAPPAKSRSDEMLIAFVGFSLAIGFFGTLIAAETWRHTGTEGAAAIIAASAFVNLIGLVALRRGVHPKICATAMMAGFFLTWSYMTLATGGKNTSMLYVGIVLPLFTVLVLGARAGAVGTLLAVGVVGATFALRKSGFDFPLSVDAEAASDASFTGAIVLPIMTFAALVLHLELRRVAQQEAEDHAAARAEAELRNRALGDEFGRLRILAGSVAHDFNNFLFAIRGNAEIAAIGAPKGSPLDESLDAIMKSSDNAAGVVKDLMVFAKRGSSDRSPLDLRDAATDVAKLAKNTFDISIEIDRAPSALWVYADPDGLNSVLLNLLKNAVEAVPNRSARVALVTNIVKLGSDDLADCAIVGEAEPGAYAAISVIDTGPGISPDQLERVFEPFVSTKSEGRGLGLTIARSFTENHKGAIDVTSQPGQTCFRVMLPIAPVPQMTPAFSRPSGLDLEGLQILVVDDEPSVRRVTSAMLANQRATPIEADSGMHAIDYLRHSGEAVDAVLIDVAMPGLGGEETFHALRALRPGLPAVIMSGHAETEFDHLGELPGVRTLRKPFSLAGLSGTIRDLLAEGD